MDSVPLSAAARRALAAEPAVIETILTGGDDFEIIAAVAPDKVEGLRAAAASASLEVTEIGVAAAQTREARFLTRDGRALAFKRPSYSHF